jgi:L,D-peptidoglycan transpeptidase YkuD (ErfK/YbiS/YcfS/YnhG family)
MTSIRARALTVLGAVALLLVGLPTSATAAPVMPQDIVGVGDAQQLIVVTAPSMRSTTAILTAYEQKKDGSWREVMDSTSAFLGYGGLAPGKKRRQGTGTTPTGTYEILRGFGRSPDPGTRLPYVRVDRNDAWTYNPRVPATYNLFQSANVSWSSYGSYVEMLWSYGRQYDYVAVLDYNLPDGKVTRNAKGVRRTDQPADTRAGGGIFLHVSKGKPTAGCISIAKPRMRQLMQWLDPKKTPVIAIGTRRGLTQG